MEVYDPDMFDSAERPGALPLASVWMLGAASLASIAIAWLGAYNLAWFLWIDSFWLQHGFGLCVAIAVAYAWVPSWRMARALRVAIVLPALVVGAIVVGWMIWRGLAPNSRYVHVTYEAPLSHELPLEVVVLVAGVLTLALARAITWRRRREWLHAWVMLSLVFLLLAGICVPIAAGLCGYRRTMDWGELSPVLDRWPFVVGIPLVLAVAWTALAVHRFERVRLRRGELVAGVVTALSAAIALQLKNDAWGPKQVYANHIHILLALAVVAAAALVSAGVATWRRRQPGDAIRGTIARDGQGTVAAFEIIGWLRGPRLACRPFEVLTRQGPVRVACDVRVIASPPAPSTRLHTGEAVRVLREGDRVVLAGFVAPDVDHPFRGSHAWIPGPHATVAREDEPPAGFAGVALAMWRPCVAYLIVVTAVALPGLASVLVGP